ncbi:hypothetical protein GWI33_014144 [Rhynchophorus ferrugineus]|uniref:Uncharacterized protein n=1 Tax=Rhynchophorus ferrugineus TaxID=354439 RepID=A0A834I5L9_RHYFE|nr:hypothetical protein GWI33_014144 [Rhynchophorus ferrugineus]
MEYMLANPSRYYFTLRPLNLPNNIRFDVAKETIPKMTDEDIRKTITQVNKYVKDGVVALPFIDMNEMVLYSRALCNELFRRTVAKESYQRRKRARTRERVNNIDARARIMIDERCSCCRHQHTQSIINHLRVRISEMNKLLQRDTCIMQNADYNFIILHLNSLLETMQTNKPVTK